MHIPDGFIDIKTSAAFAAASAVAVAGAVKGARRQLSEQSAPLAGLTAVFIFAVQMLNFPVAAGTSGHLIGAALAMVLVGPYAATLALVVVLIIQAFLFADGGLTALGLSIFNICTYLSSCSRGWICNPICNWCKCHFFCERSFKCNGWYSHHNWNR